MNVRVECGHPCGGSIDVTAAVRALPPHTKATLKIPLRCYVEQGVDLAGVDLPFSIDTDKPFVVSITNVRWQAGGGVGPEALPCTPAKKKP